jgi:ribonuclease HII
MARVVVTPAPRFNALLDKWDSKGAVLSHGLIALLADMDRDLAGDEAIEFTIDKHGGRNSYAPIIQTAFPDRWVTTLSESASESRYHLDEHGREIAFRFIPKADSDCLPVALASMIAKYLRELFMQQFNRYWQERVPDLEPTAGYPNDSKRFFGQIQRAMRQLSITERQVWRAR